MLLTHDPGANDIEHEFRLFCLDQVFVILWDVIKTGTLRKRVAVILFSFSHIFRFAQDDSLLSPN